MSSKGQQVGLRRLLQGGDGRALDAQIGLEVLRDLTHETLNLQFADRSKAQVGDGGTSRRRSGRA